jgi:hypothetical protein
MSNVFKGFGGYCDVFGRCFEVFQWYVHGGWMFVKDITILSIYFNVFQFISMYFNVFEYTYTLLECHIIK